METQLIDPSHADILRGQYGAEVVVFRPVDLIGKLNLSDTSARRLPTSDMKYQARYRLDESDPHGESASLSDLAWDRIPAGIIIRSEDEGVWATSNGLPNLPDLYRRRLFAWDYDSGSEDMAYRRMTMFGFGDRDIFIPGASLREIIREGCDYVVVTSTDHEFAVRGISIDVKDVA